MTKEAFYVLFIMLVISVCSFTYIIYVLANLRTRIEVKDPHTIGKALYKLSIKCVGLIGLTSIVVLIVLMYGNYIRT